MGRPHKHDEGELDSVINATGWRVQHIPQWTDESRRAAAVRRLAEHTHDTGGAPDGRAAFIRAPATGGRESAA